MTDSALSVGSLEDDLEAPTAAETVAERVRGALSTPYTLERWGADLRALGAGVLTGFDALDSLQVRWHSGKLYGVIARPGGGKTAFMLEAAMRYLEAHPDRLVLFLSWEEPLADVVLRLLLRSDAHTAHRGGEAVGCFNSMPLYGSTVRQWGELWGQPTPDTDALTAGSSEHQAEDGRAWDSRLVQAAVRLERVLPRLRLVDGDELGRDAGEVLRAVAAWMRETETRPGLVCVDYFQKLRAGDATSRQVELQLVADLLRRFAKGARLDGGDTTDMDAPDPAYSVPVLVGAQVNRLAAGAHPMGEHIREADDFLNDAAAIVALSWEGDGQEGAANDEARTLRLSVPKHRGGSARPESVARYAWHPARSWIAPQALQDQGDGGRVRWAKLEEDSSPSTGRARAKKDAAHNGNGDDPGVLD